MSKPKYDLSLLGREEDELARTMLSDKINALQSQLAVVADEYVSAEKRTLCSVNLAQEVRNGYIAVPLSAFLREHLKKRNKQHAIFVERVRAIETEIDALTKQIDLIGVRKLQQHYGRVFKDYDRKLKSLTKK